MKGKFTLRADPEPQPAAPKSTGWFDPMGLDPRSWKTHYDWIKEGRAAKPDVRSINGLVVRRDTVPLVDPEEHQRWLASGLPF